MNLTHTSDTHVTDRVLTYPTRFGDITLREDRLIGFEHGILGFQHCTVFGLSRMPGADESPIMLMHSVNDPDITFMVADPAILGLTIDATDQEAALKACKMKAASAQFLVILTLYEQGDSYYLTANLRAPILIDSERRRGQQHILLNTKYTTQHKI